jgi:hypothetical protein
MANTIVQATAADGGTYTLKLYAVNGDTLVNGSGDALTERTNNKGTYTATVTEALTGVHEVRVTDASDNTVASYVTEVLVDDTGTYLCHKSLPALSLAADLVTVDTVVDSILVDTAVIGAAGAGLTDLGGMSTGMKAEVNAEVDTALSTTTYAEPGQGSPVSTVSLKDKIGYLYKAWRNRSNQTATTYQLFNDDAATVDQKATVSDNATTAEKGEVTTGA